MNHDETSNCQPRDKRNPPKPRPLIIRIFNALKHYEHYRRRRSEKEKADGDLIMARWTRRLGIFTAALVIVGIVTAVVFWRQLDVMDGQLGEMQIERRAWITTEGVVDVGNFEFTNGVTPVFTFHIKISVSGSSPAEQVSGRGLIVPYMYGDDLVREQKQFCKDTANADISTVQKKLGMHRIERTITPGNTKTIPVIGLGDPVTFSRRWNNGAVNVWPVIVGCVIYRISNGSPHWTGFIYDVINKRDVRNGFSLTPNTISPARDIELHEDEIGDGPAN